MANVASGVVSGVSGGGVTERGCGAKGGGVIEAGWRLAGVPRVLRMAASTMTKIKTRMMKRAKNPPSKAARRLEEAPGRFCDHDGAVGDWGNLKLVGHIASTRQKAHPSQINRATGAVLLSAGVSRPAPISLLIQGQTTPSE